MRAQLKIVRRKAEPEISYCPVPDCWQPSRSSGFCAACYSGMHRLRQKSVSELSFYLKRLRRIQNRVAMRSGR